MFKMNSKELKLSYSNYVMSATMGNLIKMNSEMVTKNFTTAY